MRLDFWLRKASRNELIAAEQAGFERYKRHTNLDQLRGQMAGVRELNNALESRIYELESLLSHARLHVTDGALLEAIGASIGTDPAPTKLVALPSGGFSEVG